MHFSLVATVIIWNKKTLTTKTKSINMSGWNNNNGHCQRWLHLSAMHEEVRADLEFMIWSNLEEVQTGGEV